MTERKTGVSAALDGADPAGRVPGAGAQHSFLPEVPAAEGGGRGPGRPAGSRNRRTIELSAYINATFGNPVVELARLYGFATVQDIAKRDGIKAAEAAKAKLAALAKVAEYTDQRQPVAVQLEADGDVAVSFVLSERVMRAAGIDPQLLLGEGNKIIADQQVSDEDAAWLDVDPLDGEA